MTVEFEELSDSPHIIFDRSGGSATRRFRVAWDDVTSFVAEALPPPSAGYSGVALIDLMPGLIAQSVDYAPWPQEAPKDECGPEASYDDAVVTIQYGPPKIDTGLNQGGDDSGPGGEDGSGSPEADNITHTVHLGGEFMTLPSCGLRWNTGRGHNGQRNGKSFIGGVDDESVLLAAHIDQDADPILRDDEEPFKVNDDIHAGRIVGTMEHSIGNAKVGFPDWDFIRAAVGKVNMNSYIKAPAECLLFLGVEADWSSATEKSASVGPGKYPCWNLTYKFSEKNHGSVGSPKGWNFFFRTDTGRWERMVRRMNGGPIYDLLEFNTIPAQIIEGVPIPAIPGLIAGQERNIPLT